MPLIVVSGPHGVGKTAYINELERQWPHTAIVRFWSGPTLLEDNAIALSQDILRLRSEKNLLIIWENSWVVATLHHLAKKFPNQGSEFLPEWLYSRAVDALGIRLMILPPEGFSPIGRSVISAEKDIEFYRSYAEKYGWEIITNDYEKTTLQENVAALINRLENLIFAYWPPLFAGPPKARAVCIDTAEQRRGKNHSALTLPQTNTYRIPWVEQLGPMLLKFAWADCKAIPLHVVRQFPTVVALSDDSFRWSHTHVNHHHIIRVPGYADWRYEPNSTSPSSVETKMQKMDETRDALGEVLR